MRRQVALVALATTSLLLIAFLVPLGLLVRTLAADRAAGAAQQEAQALVPVVASSVRDPAELTLVLQRVNSGTPRRVTVFLPDGRRVGALTQPGPSLALARQGRAFSTTVPGGRQILQPVLTTGGTAVITSFVPSALLSRGVHRALTVLGLLGLALLAVSVLVADRLARGVVRPMSELAAVSTRLERGDLSARVVPTGPPEIREVGTALNRLAERIRELLQSERETVADLSHRLRTPVTALRLDAEALRDPEEAERLSGDVDELQRAVDRIIRTARRPDREGVRATSDAASVVQDRAAFWRVLAEDQSRRFSVQVDPMHAVIALGADELAAALDAVLGNVFAHTPEGIAIAVRLAEEGPGRYRLSMEDDGPGLPDPSLLERGASARNSTGLGLDIARRAAEKAGGQLILSTGSQGGALVELLLPSAPS
jgi:signal transduction histidine kinase